MKARIEAFKKLWAIPRYKAIIQLLLWISFFLIIFAVLAIISLFGQTKINNKNIKDNSVKYTEMTSYEYTYEIKYTLENKLYELNVVGTKYNDKNSFKLNGTKYFIIDGYVYDINNNLVSDIIPYYNVAQLEPIAIDELLKTALNKEETLYKDGSKKTEYTLSNVLITTYESKDYLNKIELDLSNYVKTIDNKITAYNIIINYTNINNIDSFN